MAMAIISRRFLQHLNMCGIGNQSLQFLHILRTSEGLTKFLNSPLCGATDEYISKQPSFVRTFCRTTSDLVDDDSNKDGEAETERKPKGGKRKVEILDEETSIRYINSEAYKQTYGQLPVWKPYRRNHKYAIPPRETRKTCVRKGYITTGSPCPICRDDYLVLHETNIKLLEQFICKHTGEILQPRVTGICRIQHRKLRVAIMNAREYGYLEFEVPFRKYNYSEYYGKAADNMK